MQDRLDPREDVHPSVADGPLTAIDEAIDSTTDSNARAAGGCARHPQRGILVHCDMGHNRSPAVCILTLLRRGLSLRESHRYVLNSRPEVDPLPPYHRLFRTVEAQLRGGETTVDEDELFALHVSQLPSSDAMGADSLEVLEEAMAERIKALNSFARGERI
jgi:hypothetical protein